MTTNQDILQLGKRVAATHGWPAAKAFKAYQMSDADRAVISRCAVDLLAVFPPQPDAPADLGTMMSAALAVSIERAIDAPVYVMRGYLGVDGRPVLGPAYGWLMVGPYVVDIALFRLAYSAAAPALLSKHVDLAFGPNKALYVDHWSMTRRVGLRYLPEQVLSEAEVTALMGEAFHRIKQARET
ncbi:hypothetical protein [Novosphingobium sp. KACC 22771]|uniref:hypothetical protein n=1 Tax=Novosphingobium sp. KACC 22771 TaxID=3025670 RepID=UPI0023664532|nr:hypothetical protein [Novosphingobium sp. KACC 22771]WDF71183.1 hypothetical protein PQ467_10115 [Novosphingobium sp. KACC 22771]